MRIPRGISALACRESSVLVQTKYRSAFDPQGPCAPSPLGPVRSRRQRSGSEGQAALRETEEGGSPILSLHHTSHLFSRLAGA